MRSAIQTKFIGPTNHRGSRVKEYDDAFAFTGCSKEEAEKAFEACLT